MALNNPTFSPKILILLVFANSEFSAKEISREPDTIVVPASVGITWLEPVKTTSLLSLTLTPVAVSITSLLPVKSSGIDKGFKLCNSSGKSSELSPSSVAISKFNKRPSWLIRTKLSPGTAEIVISPPGAEILPVLIIVPPNKVTLSPALTVSSPSFKITPGFVIGKEKALGFPVKIS